MENRMKFIAFSFTLRKVKAKKSNRRIFYNDLVIHAWFSLTLKAGIFFHFSGGM
jgi:hypothetical protein